MSSWRHPEVYHFNIILRIWSKQKTFVKQHPILRHSVNSPRTSYIFWKFSPLTCCQAIHERSGRVRSLPFHRRLTLQDINDRKISPLSPRGTSFITDKRCTDKYQKFRQVNSNLSLTLFMPQFWLTSTQPSAIVQPPEQENWCQQKLGADLVITLLYSALDE